MSSGTCAVTAAITAAEAAAERDVRTRMNHYLFHELEICGDDREEARVSEDWPFSLRPVWASTGDSHKKGNRSNKDNRSRMCITVYQFSDGAGTCFVQASPCLSFWRAEDMISEELQLHMVSEEWIAAHGAIDLSTNVSHEPSIPTSWERRRAVEEIAARSLPGTRRVDVLEGLFLPQEDRHVALVEDTASGRAFLVGTGIEARKVRHSEAAPWRRLAVVIGQMVERGELK